MYVIRCLLSFSSSPSIRFFCHSVNINKYINNLQTDCVFIYFPADEGKVSAPEDDPLFTSDPLSGGNIKTPEKSKAESNGVHSEDTDDDLFSTPSAKIPPPVKKKSIENPLFDDDTK